jgi:hypothetical protein
MNAHIGIFLFEKFKCESNEHVLIKISVTSNNKFSDFLKTDSSYEILHGIKYTLFDQKYPDTYSKL